MPPPDYIALPSPLTLARQQSAFSVVTANETAGGQLTIRYQITSDRDEEVGELLLVTTLQPGVGLVSAEPTPDERLNADGTRDLAFVLPSLPPYGDTSATLTLALPAGPGPLTLDNVARAFGNLRTRAVNAGLGPTKLRHSDGSLAHLLVSTIDANTSDRYVLEQTGRIVLLGDPDDPSDDRQGCDPTRPTETATFYSLIESAKLCGIEPRGYLGEAARRAIRDPGTVTLPRDHK